MLYATVRQRKIHVKQPVDVIQNGVHVDMLTLDMDDEWRDMDTIICVFTCTYQSSGSDATVVKEKTHTFGEPIEVPWECLEHSGSLTVSCAGYVGEEKIMTTMLPDSAWNIVQNGPLTGDEEFEHEPSLVQQILAAASAAQSAAEDVQTRADNGEFDGEQGPQGIQGVQGPRGLQGSPGQNGADGADGVSPAVSVETITGGHAVTITDADGDHTFNVMDGTDGADGSDGTDGTDGVSPTVSITEITGGHRVTVTDESGSHVFNVMDGADGVDGTNGQDGADGVSPTVSVETIAGGHEVTITDATGSYAFDVMDGEDGAPGQQGQPGQPGQQGSPGADGYSPTVTITDITGGHRVTITDKDGSHVFDVMDGQGGGGTGDHTQLSNRDAENQHPMSAIAGLVDALSGKQPNISDLDTIRSGAGAGATAYQKPAGGIPKTDLASSVQESISKADSALQSVPNTYRTASAQDTIDAGKQPLIVDLATIRSGAALGATAVQPAAISGMATQSWVQNQGYGTYSKPSGGIPKTDLATPDKLLDANTFDAVTDWSTQLVNGAIAWRYE